MVFPAYGNLQQLLQVFFWLPKMTNEKTNKQTETSTILEKKVLQKMNET